MNKIVLTIAAVLALICVVSATSVVASYELSIRQQADNCLASWQHIVACKTRITDLKQQKDFVQFAVPMFLARRFAEYKNNQPASIDLTQSLANDVQYARSGIAEACYWGLAAETGPITSLPYAQWYEGEDAPASYSTYITTSPISLPISNCAIPSVFYPLHSTDYKACDMYHTVMSYYYIGAIQPACPF
jgi:hypothetical protein